MVHYRVRQSLRRAAHTVTVDAIAIAIAARLLLRASRQITQKGDDSFERPADPTAYCNAQKRRSLIVGLNHFEAMAPKPETSSFLEQYFSLARAVFD